MTWRLGLAAVAILLLTGTLLWFVLPGASPVVPGPPAEEPSGDMARSETPLEAEKEPQADEDPEPRLRDIADPALTRDPRLGLADPRLKDRPATNPFGADAKDTDESADESAEKDRNVRAVGLGSSKSEVANREPPEEATPALRWLAANQNREGFWSDDAPVAEGAEPVASTFNVAMAMLAHLRTGASHKGGPSRATMRQAIFWARKVQQNDGNFAASESIDPLLHHAAATCAIAEAYSLSRDLVLKAIVDKSVEYLCKARGSTGAWGMNPNDANPNVVVTGWALLALRTASQAGITVDEQVFAEAAMWAWTLRRGGFIAWSSAIDRMPVEGIAPADGVMADAVYLLALKWGGDVAEGELAVLERLQQHRAVWDGTTNDLMAWFFTATALQVVAPDHAPEWNALTFEQINGAAVAETGEDKIDRASWTSTDYWSSRFGKVYTTSMASMLQAHCTPPPVNDD